MNRIVQIAETASTNTLLLEQLNSRQNSQAAADTPLWQDGDMMVCYRQTDGRGQRGNHWESAPGQNIALSLLLCPRHLPASEAFLVSEAFSVAVCRCLEALGIEPLHIKWPNDIYAGNGKLGGILIENTLSGPWLKASVCGLGLNVNQTRFLSDAPNPVSLKGLTGRDYDLPTLTADLHRHFLAANRQLAEALDKGQTSSLQADYRQRLYRREGWHPYRDSEGLFEGQLVDVGSDGRLSLRRGRDGEVKKYAFKEVSFVI